MKRAPKIVAMLVAVMLGTTATAAMAKPVPYDHWWLGGNSCLTVQSNCSVIIFPAGPANISASAVNQPVGF